MITAQKMYWFSATAQAAYADFNDGQIYEKSLQKGIDGEPLFSQTQAEAFAAEWYMVNHLADQPATPQNGMGSGFSATLFQRNTGDKDYVLAFRGTMGLDDLAVTDGGDIVVDGVASSQIIDLYNYWMTLSTPQGQTFAKAVVEPASAALQIVFSALGPVGGMAAANAAGYYWDSGKAYKIVRSETDTGTGLGAIPAGAKLTVTGHSLGGHLAAAFTRLFPEAGAETLTINGAGFGLLQTSNVNTFFNLLAGHDTAFDNSKITNLYGDKNPEFVTQDFLLSQKGIHLPLWIEQSTPWQETAGHGSGQMVEAAAIYDLFIRLDSNLKAIAVAEMLDKVTPFIEAVSSQRVNTFESAIDSFRRLFGLPELANIMIDDRETFYKALIELESTPAFTALEGKVKIELSTTALADRAKTDISALVSLTTLRTCSRSFPDLR